MLGACGTDGTSILKPRIVIGETKEAEIGMLTEIMTIRKEHYWQDPLLTNDKNITCPAILASDLPQRSDNSMTTTAVRFHSQNNGCFFHGCVLFAMHSQKISKYT